jgi:hypothetical protein
MQLFHPPDGKSYGLGSFDGQPIRFTDQPQRADNPTPDLTTPTPPATAIKVTDQYLIAPFRMLSAANAEKNTFWGKKLIIDFSTKGGDVLQAAVDLADGIPIYPNHSTDIEDWLGKVIKTKWTPAINGKAIPGINGEFQLWRGVDAQGEVQSERHYSIAEGVAQGVIDRTSVGVLYEFEKSHPLMDDAQFYSVMGTLVDNQLVRLVATRILQFFEVSLVQMGADKYATRERFTTEIVSLAGTPPFAVFSEQEGLVFLSADGKQRRTLMGEVLSVQETTATGGIPAEPQETVDLAQTIQLNAAAATHARSLIAAGKVNKTAAWAFSAEDGNALLGDKGDDWKNFGSYHLAVYPGQAAESKAHYGYPFGKGGEVYRSALIAIRSTSAGGRGAQPVTAVFEEAGKLIDLIDKQTEQKQDASAPVEQAIPETPVQQSLTLTEKAQQVELDHLRSTYADLETKYLALYKEVIALKSINGGVQQQTVLLTTERDTLQATVQKLTVELESLQTTVAPQKAAATEYLTTLRDAAAQAYLQLAVLRSIDNEAEKAAMLTTIQTTDLGSVKDLLTTFNTNIQASLPEFRQSLPQTHDPVTLAVLTELLHKRGYKKSAHGFRQ